MKALQRCGEGNESSGVYELGMKKDPISRGSPVCACAAFLLTDADRGKAFDQREIFFLPLR